MKDNEINPQLKTRLEQLLRNEGFEAAVTRQAAYIPSRDFSRVCDDYDLSGCPIEQPDKQQSERRWMQFVDQLTKTLKKSSYPHSRRSDFNNTGRILKHIGFKGKDKITCIFEILPYEEHHSSVVIHYGQPPAILLDEWRRKKGDWVVKKSL